MGSPSPGQPGGWGEYLADSGHTGHHLLSVAVILYRSLAEEEVDLVVVPSEALHTLRDEGRAHKVRFYGEGREGSVAALPT